MPLPLVPGDLVGGARVAQGGGPPPPRGRRGWASPGVLAGVVLPALLLPPGGACVAWAQAGASGPGPNPAIQAQGVPAAAAPPPPVQVGGVFFTRYERRVGYSLPDLGGDVVRYRAQMTAELRRPVSDHLEISFRFVPLVGGFWDVGGDTFGDPTLTAHEAYTRLQAPRGWLQVGRSEMSYGEDLILGSVPWHHTGRVFEGARGRWNPKPDGPWVDVFGVLLAEGDLAEVPPTTGAPLAGDRWLLGAYAGLGPVLWPGQLDVYALERLGLPGQGGFEVEHLLTVGTRARARLGSVDLRLEPGVQVGSRGTTEGSQEVQALQADGEVGVTAPVGEGLRLAVGAAWAAGDDPTTPGTFEAWDQLYPSAHPWFGLMDVVGPRTNLVDLQAHVACHPKASLRLSADGHHLSMPEPPAGTAPYIGSEVDLGARWQVGPPLALRAAFDVFVPPGDADWARFVELEVAASF